jgi:hypothetical protein
MRVEGIGPGSGYDWSETGNSGTLVVGEDLGRIGVGTG